MEPILPVLILNARPAAGKSEIIAYLKSLGDDERKNRFHLGRIVEIDDFPMLWTWFEEDAILAEIGEKRLHTDEKGYFLHHNLWNLLIRRICLEYEKLVRDDPLFHEGGTALIEFSRGSEHGGYTEAFGHLSDRILKIASVLYVDVSYEESVRKNQKRFNPDRPDSVLEHGLPSDKMETLYKEIDWQEFAGNNQENLLIANHRVPYSVLDNSMDVTTAGGELLGASLERALNTIWTLFRKARET